MRGGVASYPIPVPPGSATARSQACKDRLGYQDRLLGASLCIDSSLYCSDLVAHFRKKFDTFQYNMQQLAFSPTKGVAIGVRRLLLLS